MDMYNFNQISKKTLDRNVRLEAQQNKMIQEGFKSATAEADAKEAAINEAALSGARFGYASTLKRSQDRVRALQEEIRYTNDASLIAMTEMVSQIVEKGLLLDEEEYTKLNPNYKTEIRETVKELLENGDLKTTKNPDMLEIMEYVSHKLPGVKDGKYLTEDEISALFSKDTPVSIEKAINSLSGNVSSKVATLVEKEQKRVSKVEKDLEKVAPAPDENVPADDATPVEGDPNDPNAVQPEDGAPVEGQDEMPVEDGTEQSEPAVDENGNPIEGADVQEPAVDENGNPIEDPNAQAGGAPTRQIHIAPDGTTNISMPNGELALNQDGSMDISLMESFVHETPRTGIVESLAVNEAMNMLEKGEAYNADKAIANAILYITITEALGETGLMTVNEQTYADIIVNAGGSLNESKRGDKLRLKATKLEAKAKELRAKASVEDAKKGEVTQAQPQQKPLQESVVYQWKPNMQNTSSNDLAERIRMKRMLKESNKNLNE